VKLLLRRIGMQDEISAEGLALLYLRVKSGLTRPKLAALLGWADDGPLGLYERGKKRLHREQLDALVARMGRSPEEVDVLTCADGMITPPPPDEAFSPVGLSAQDRKRLHRAAMAAAWTLAEKLREGLTRKLKADKAAAARREAQALLPQLLKAGREERRELVAVFPEFQSWAMAEKLCEASVQAAARSPAKALELAELALFVAGWVGEEAWRRRVQGYCWAFVANAHRVANDFDQADAAFEEARKPWRDGADPDGLLPEWQMLDLEASQHRDRQRFEVALDRLDRARVLAGSNTHAVARILVNKEYVLERLGRIDEALAVLEEAEPFIKASADQRLHFALLFNRTANLFHLGRYRDGARLLPSVRGLAERQRNAIDLFRVVWLEARLASGMGRTQEALARLEEVQKEFTAVGLAVDAALCALDRAVLLLREGRTGEVHDLGLSLAWVFSAREVHREALAALALFCQAAQDETATVQLAQQVIADIERARRAVAPRAIGPALGTGS
jgi:tetratricopeptide (TPR) repeat protein